MKDWWMVLFCIILWIAAMEIVKDRAEYGSDKIIQPSHDLIDKQKQECVRYGKNDYDCRRINTTTDL